MKVAIYIRVSTEEQAREGYSISAQKQKLKAFCISQEWDVYGMYVDEGISAKNMERPQLKQMIQDIQDKKIDCVLVYRLDRLTRSVMDLYKLLELFEQYDCKFKSATEVYDTTTAMGRMFITIVAALAQWERENMGERISMGFAEKVRQGKYALNFRPFGYDLDLKTGQLTINPGEAKVVRMIFGLYIKGYGGNRVCKYLNERNITTRDGNPWNDKPLMQLLKNPLYIGSLRWNDFVVDDTHEPIISKEMFEEVQKLIVNRRTSEPRRVSSDYFFSGKLKCNVCSHPLVGRYVISTLATGEKKKYKSYRCLRKKTGECNGSRTLSENKIEAAFIDYLTQQDFSKAAMKQVAAANDIKKKDTPDVDREFLEKELDKLERKRKKFQYAWSEDLISDEDFRKRMEEVKKEENEIQKQLATVELPKEEKIYTPDALIEALKNMPFNWSQLEDMEKKQMIDSIIKQVHYVQDNHVVTVDRIDFY